MSPAVSTCAILGNTGATPQVRHATNRSIHAAATHSASLRTNVAWRGRRRSDSRPRTPPPNTTPGQRHFLASGHPWQTFAAPPHGLTTIRHDPVPEIRAHWRQAVSGKQPRSRPTLRCRTMTSLIMCGDGQSFGPTTCLGHPCPRPRLPSRPWPGKLSASPDYLRAWQGTTNGIPEVRAEQVKKVTASACPRRSPGATART